MKQDKLDLSVIILTYNEELHIERCINSLRPFAKQIFVIDSFSTDSTVAIAERLDAKIFTNPWVNYGQQFQWALDNCPISTEWVMRVDADEYSSSELVDDIINKLPFLSTSTTGILVNLRWYFLGKSIRYGGRYSIQLLRIWRTGKVHIEQRWMDEHLVLDEGDIIRFNGDHIDHNLNTISWFIEKHNKYATREMIDIINQKYYLFTLDKSLSINTVQQAKYKRLLKESVYNMLPIFVRPTLYFFYRYIIRLGFLDGKEGFAYHFMQGYWYRCLVDLKVLEAERLLKGVKSKPEMIERLSKLTGLSL